MGGGSANDKEALLAFYKTLGGDAWKAVYERCSKTTWRSHYDSQHLWPMVKNVAEAGVFALILEDQEIRSHSSDGMTWQVIPGGGKGLNGDGKFPVELSYMTNMEAILMPRNGFTGIIEPIIPKQLKLLKSVSLSHNKLTGPIPEDFGNLHQLEKLELAHNQLTGTIPGKWLQIKHLDVSYNQMKGGLPDGLADQSGLSYLNFAHNKMTGEIPAKYNELAHCLTVLDVSYNEFSGQVPDKLLLSSSLQLGLQHSGINILDLVAKDIALYPWCLVERNVILGWERFLPHERLLADKVLLLWDRTVKHFELSCFKKGGEGDDVMVNRKNVALVSHRWLTPSMDPAVAHPDDLENSKLTHLKALLTAKPDIHFVFMDFMCVPQADRSNQALAIACLPFYVRNTGNFFAVASTEETFNEYRGRAWCALEMLTAQCPYPVYDYGEPLWKRDIDQRVSIWNDGDREERNFAEIVQDVINPVEGRLTSEYDRESIAIVTSDICRELAACSANAASNGVLNGVAALSLTSSSDTPTEAERIRHAIQSFAAVKHILKETSVFDPYSVNMIQNGSAEWGVDQDWSSSDVKTEKPPDAVPALPSRCVASCFSTSYNWGQWSQQVDLLAQGFTRDFLDAGIAVLQFRYAFVCRTSEAPVQATLQLFTSLENNEAEPVNEWQHQHSVSAKREWDTLMHQVKLPTGTRYIRVSIQGKDAVFWRGQFGPKVTAISLRFVRPPKGGVVDLKIEPLAKLPALL